jgi:hypothetical protein
MNDESPERIEATFRNGSVTVVGVIVGFTLTFLTSWATAPTPWHIHDLLGVVPLAGGAVLQLVSLASLLRTNSLERPVYDRAVRYFLTGLVLVSLGLVVVIALDALTEARRG